MNWFCSLVLLLYGSETAPSVIKILAVLSVVIFTIAIALRSKREKSTKFIWSSYVVVELLNWRKYGFISAFYWAVILCGILVVLFFPPTLRHCLQKNSVAPHQILIAHTVTAVRLFYDWEISVTGKVSDSSDSPALSCLDGALLARGCF